MVSLINLGISIKGITAYAKRDSRPVITTPQQASTQKQLSLLQAGSKLPHPPHIPSYFPDLPDPHAYIRTPVRKKQFFIFEHYYLSLKEIEFL